MNKTLRTPLVYLSMVSLVAVTLSGCGGALTAQQSKALAAAPTPTPALLKPIAGIWKYAEGAYTYNMQFTLQGTQLIGKMSGVVVVATGAVDPVACSFTGDPDGGAYIGPWTQGRPNECQANYRVAIRQTSDNRIVLNYLGSDGSCGTNPEFTLSYQLKRVQ